MRAAFFLMPGWNEPETAPLGEEVILAVTDGQGEPATKSLPTYRRRLDQLQKWNAAAGHACEMETLCQAP
jgi:hypothetical protein